MTVQVGDILRVALEYSLPNSSQALNVFTYIVDEFTGENADCVADFQEFFEDTWGPAWDNIGSGSADIIGFAIDVLNTNGTVGENVGAASLAIPGTVGNEISASAVSAYLLAQTDIPKTRGSKYVPGLTEAHVADGVINGTGLALITDLLLMYLDPLVPTSGNKYLPGVLARTLAQFVPFNASGSLTNVPAYQRRRKSNVGS